MITTALTRLFGLDHPIVLAPMGGVAGGALAAAVSNAGGLGLVGGGYGDADWLRTELNAVRRATTRPWGAGLITWSASRAVLDQVLAARPHAVLLSFGDPRPHGALIKAAGCKLICQVQDLAGADLVVAQGALVGTRFHACDEALGSLRARQCIVQASGDETARTRVFDVVRGLDWPALYTGRALRNGFMARWQGDEAGLARDVSRQREAFQAAQRDEDFDTAMVWAGEAVDLIDDVAPAAHVVERLARDA